MIDHVNGISRQSRLSVIVPLYNMGRHIEAALESMRAQSFADWDAWIVDDGSKDNGPEIAKRFATQYPEKFHYLEHEGRQNRGVSASRNLALEKSSGEMVAFLDADDLWEPDKLQKQVKVLTDHPEVGLVYCSAVPIQADGNPWKPSDDGEPPVKIVRDSHGQPRIGYGKPARPIALFEEMVQHYCLVTSGVIVRRGVLDKAGRFDTTMRYAEDWLLFTCVAYHTMSYFIEEPLVRYRIHSGHFSSSLRGDELAPFRGVAVFLGKLPAQLRVRDANVAVLVDRNSRVLYGRALSRAEEARRQGRYKESFEFIRFGIRTFPGLLFSRRTVRFVFQILNPGAGHRG